MGAFNLIADKNDCVLTIYVHEKVKDVLIFVVLKYFWDWFMAWLVLDEVMNHATDQINNIVSNVEKSWCALQNYCAFDSNNVMISKFAPPPVFS
jgi:hypothetical protein